MQSHLITSRLYIGKISVFLIYRRMYFAVEHRRDISLSYMQTHVLRRCTSARFQSSLYTDGCTSPLYIGKIPVFLINRRTYLAVEHRRDISLSHIQTHVLRRCTSARYQSSLYTDAPTSPLYTGEIYISLPYMQTHVPRRCTPARYQSSLYTDAPTLPLYIGEIPVFLIYRHMYLAVEHRRDISLSYIQTHVLRSCTLARYQSSFYTDAPTSPLYIGEIPAFLIYRHMYLAVEHRREISLSYTYIQTHVLRRCISARYQSSLYTDASTTPMFNGEISVFLQFLIYRHIVPRRCTSARYKSFLYTDA